MHFSRYHYRSSTSSSTTTNCVGRNGPHHPTRTTVDSTRRHRLHRRRSSNNSKKNRHSTIQEKQLQQLQMKQKEQMQQIGIASIFVTTFDMNWSMNFPSNLNDWIPSRKDLYVFSLQHYKIGIQKIEQQIQKYLSQINFPITYHSVLSKNHTHHQEVSKQTV
jgi:hypothetical protein